MWALKLLRVGILNRTRKYERTEKLLTIVNFEQTFQTGYCASFVRELMDAAINLYNTSWVAYITMVYK